MQNSSFFLKIFEVKTNKKKIKVKEFYKKFAKFIWNDKFLHHTYVDEDRHN
jgi:hypothetical protein